MMNQNITTTQTFLTKEVVSLYNLLSNESWKSTAISFKSIRTSVFISWVIYSAMTLRNFYPSLLRVLSTPNYIGQSYIITIFRAIFSSTIFNSRRNLTKNFLTNQTQSFFCFSQTRSTPAKERSTFQRTTLLISLFIFYLNRLFTSTAYFFDQRSGFSHKAQALYHLNLNYSRS